MSKQICFDSNGHQYLGNPPLSNPDPAILEGVSKLLNCYEDNCKKIKEKEVQIAFNDKVMKGAVQEIRNFTDSYMESVSDITKSREEVNKLRLKLIDFSKMVEEMDIHDSQLEGKMRQLKVKTNELNRKVAEVDDKVAELKSRKIEGCCLKVVRSMTGNTNTEKI